MIPVYWWEMSAKIEQRVLHIDFTFRICNLTIFIISAEIKIEMTQIDDI